MNPPTNKNQDYRSTDGLVRIRTTRVARRWPPHDYPVVIVELRPQRGTRVLALEGGRTEWMLRYDELAALILRMGLSVSAVPPNKPEERRLRFQKINARRHRRAMS